MKKALLASTAIVAAAALASPANAADRIKLGVGGFMEQYIGFVDNEDDANVTDFAAFDTQSDTEVYISGSTTLDNGIKISARMDFEGDAVGTTVDEAYMTIQTAWGSLKVGQDDDAADDFANNLQRGISSDHDNWIVPRGVSRALGDDAYASFGGDNNKLNYTTPNLFGMFQAGVSYTPEQASQGGGGATPNRIGGTSSSTAFGAQLTPKFGEVDLKATYAYSQRGGDGTRALVVGGVAAATYSSGHHAGLEGTFAGFTAGLAYGRVFGNHEIATDDGYAWHGSLSYKAGPMQIGFYHQQESTERAAGGSEDEVTLNSVFFNYTLSDGVRWESIVFNSDIDSGAADATFNDGGWGVVGGIRLDF